MKFSLNIEYTEKEYITSTRATGGLFQQVLNIFLTRYAGMSVVEEEEGDAGDVLPFPVEVPAPKKAAPEPEAKDEDEAVAKAERKRQKQLLKGEKAFSEFIREWLEGIDIDTLLPREGVAQPDRDMLLRSYANGPTAYPILLFVQSCGGLQQAVAKVTNSERLGLDLTRFIVPPASIAFPDLSDQYEYSNPFRKDDDE